MNEPGLFDIFVVTFVPMAIAAALLRTKGTAGWLVIVVMAGVVGFILFTLSGSNMMMALASALAGLLAGGKVSDWRELQRTKQASASERRDRDARFK